MFEFHDDRHANLVLNLINRESRSVAQGMERRVLEFKWAFHDLPAHSLAPAVGRLCLEGLVFAIGNVLRLTPRGYQLLTAPQIAENTEVLLAAQRENGPPTEFSLRNRLLSVFSLQKLKAGDRLALEEIRQFWQAAHYRASELQEGLDILLRDGAIRMSRIFGTYVRLEQEGENYMRGRPTPAWLQRLSPVLDRNQLKTRTISSKTLRFLVVHQFNQIKLGHLITAEELDYRLEQYELPAYARFHALDLAWRLGDIDLTDNGAGLRVSEAGTELQDSLRSGLSQTLIQMELTRMKTP